MTATTAIVHVMAGNNLVTDSKLVQGHDVVNCLTFESIEILYGEHIILVPLQLETRSVVDGRLHVALIEQVIDSLLINLQIRAIDGKSLFPGVRLLLNQVKKKPDRTRYDAFILTGFELCDGRLVCLDLLVLITLHGECFAAACLTISKHCGVIALFQN